jgi:hypothetical protein
MAQKITKILTGTILTLAFVLAFCTTAKAQSKIEKLILYENFGGSSEGSSVTGILPDAWPAVHSDSAKQSGWYTTPQKLDGTNNTAMVPQFYNNGIFHTDSLKKYRTGGLSGLTGVTVDDLTKTWSYSVPLRNNYTMPGSGASSLSFRCLGIAAFPEFYSWVSYGQKTPIYLKNQTDEKGYLYFGKDPTINTKVMHPILTIPGSDIDYLKNVSKIEMLISGSRTTQFNTMSITIEEITEDGITVGTKTLTYSAHIEPRFITIPVNKDFVRISIQAWGSATNANVTDLSLLTSNTEVDTRTPYNWNAIAGLSPVDGITKITGVNSNPGMSIHMIKIYAYVTGGYTIKTDNALVSGTKSGISYGDSTTLTAQATNNGHKFMGWNISGMPNLSEVVNPLKIAVKSDTMSVMPVYAGDQIELPVVNENFTNWTQVGTADATKNNGLIYTLDAPTGTLSGAIRVPLRYGFTSGGKDSVDITLNTCYVIPQYGLRVYNIPGWEKYPGYIAFMGPKATKGYVSVGSLDGITKAEVDLSNIDVAGTPGKGCVIRVNGTTVRNKMLQTLYAQNVVVKNDPASSFALQVGPGNAALYEYITPETATVDVLTASIVAAPVAMHNLKLYAKVTVPDKNYYKLTSLAVTGGYITGCYPPSGNSTNQYMEGTKVTIGATPFLGYGFDGWIDQNGASLGSSNTITITMDANKTVKALFAQNPSYIKLIANPKGSVTYNISPKQVSHDTLTFLAGVPLNLTATGVYGYKVTKWTTNGADSINRLPNPKTEVLPIAAANMIKNNYRTLSVTYDTIIDRQTIYAVSDTTQGKITFDHNPENITYNLDTLKGKFPKYETITFTPQPAYGFGFLNWRKGLSLTDTLTTPATLVMTADRKIGARWSVLARKLLIMKSGTNGSIRITDSHKDGTQEQLGKWPSGYAVQLTASPAKGFELTSLGANVSTIFINDSVVTVLMDQDTVTVTPKFAQKVEGVVLAVNEFFQDPNRWPEPAGTVSNVPGAIEFLNANYNANLSADWDPRTYNNNLKGLLTILTPYRTWGSLSNDNSDGPGGSKTPKTTLILQYQKSTLVRKLQVGNSKDSVKLTVVNYAPCNNCLISKAVKPSYVDNKYLGKVTPGFIALKKISPTNRSANTNPAFIENDSIGMMIIEGLAYVEKVNIGFVSGGTQFCPGVFWTTSPSIELMKSTGLFGGFFSDINSIGQLTRTDYSPYSNQYGWGASQEGMLMDQNMYVAEKEAVDTRILITSGYKKIGTTGAQTYSYSDVYIHDLKIWGSPKKSTGIIDLIAKPENSDCKFYMLGSSNNLKVDASEPIKALVLYNLNGVAIKVIRNINTNIIDIGDIQTGYYGAHAYGISGKIYKGAFVKLK